MLEFSTNMFLRENLINVDLKDVFIATALKKWAAKRLLNISTTMQSLKDNIKAANQCIVNFLTHEKSHFLRMCYKILIYA